MGQYEDETVDRSAQRTVLVVEDEPGIRLALGRALGRGGYGVVAAANGAEALRLLAEHGEIDVVVTDLTMPEMTGEQLVARLREERPAMPVVIMSGYSPALLESRGARAGQHFLQKPFQLEQLLRMVGDALAADPVGER